MCDTQIFYKVTEIQMNKVRQALRAQGLTVPFENFGTISGKITADYIYNTRYQELTVQIIKKPWYISCQRIKNEIQKALDK